MASRRRAAVAVLLSLSTVGALQPPLGQDTRAQPSRAQPLRAGSLRTARHGKPLLAQQAEPAPTLAGSLVAGGYTGLMQFTFSAACAAVIFGPVGLPITIGVQHCLIGFMLMQTVVSWTTGVPAGVVLSVPSFEVLPFLSKFAVIVAGAVGTTASPTTVSEFSI